MEDAQKPKEQLVEEIAALRLQLAATKGAATAMPPIVPRNAQEREAFITRLLNASINGIYVYNVVAGCNDYTNPRYTAITGWSRDEINGMDKEKFSQLFHPDDRDRVFEHIAAVTQLADDEILDVEYRFRTKDDRWAWCLSWDTVFDRQPDGSVKRFIGTFVDITDRKRAQEERIEAERRLQHAQRLESLGVLAGGIAHDFNNILMTVLGNAALALDELPPLSPGRMSIGEIEKGARRAADLCRQMLAYAGKGQFVKERLQVGNLIEEMTHMLKTCVSKKALLNLNLTRDLPPVDADPAQLRQVLMNLVINASEAIGDRSGVITISTGMVECTADYLRDTALGEDLAPGSYIDLEVSDTGDGMDQATKERLFEPFFTTKFTGRGLGLSAVIGIVQGHGGALKVYSELDRGTTFKILLPAADQHVAETDAVPTDDAAWSGTHTVLLVDDEETVRAVGGTMLRRLGLNVVTAEDGRRALDIYRERADEIDLVMLDLTMPQMDGDEAFRELRAIDPGVRVVLSSGYSETDVAARFAGKGLAGVIQKPYSLAELRKLLGDAMATAAEST